MLGTVSEYLNLEKVSWLKIAILTFFEITLLKAEMPLLLTNQFAGADLLH